MYKIVSYSADHVEKVCGVWRMANNRIVSPYAESVVREYQEIPCGHCIDCRLKYSREWANRCMMELSYYEPVECWFLTLTYDNEHLCDVNSDIFPGTLVKEDLQRFWKRLRRYNEYHDIPGNIRYYACGEYGSNTLRPHYHAIVYGLPVVDLESWERSKSGFTLFRSPLLEKIWQNGIVCLSPVTWDTCAYTARYVLKKVDHDIKLYHKEGVEPEFIVMSRRPGIGRKYYDEHSKNIYRFDEIILKDKDGGRKVRPPKYFDSLFEAADPTAYEEIKNKRKEKAEAATLLKMSHTDLGYLDQLRVEEEALISRIKALRRDKI